MDPNGQPLYLAGTNAAAASAMLTGSQMPQDSNFTPHGLPDINAINEHTPFEFANGTLQTYEGDGAAATPNFNFAGQEPPAQDFHTGFEMGSTPMADPDRRASAQGGQPAWNQFLDLNSPLTQLAQDGTSYQPACDYPEPSYNLPGPYYPQNPNPYRQPNPVRQHQPTRRIPSGQWVPHPELGIVFVPSRRPQAHGFPPGHLSQRPSYFPPPHYEGNGMPFPTSLTPGVYGPSPVPQRTPGYMPSSRQPMLPENTSPSMQPGTSQHTPRTPANRRHNRMASPSDDGDELEIKIYTSPLGRILYGRKERAAGDPRTKPSNFYTDKPPRARSWISTTGGTALNFSYTKNGQWREDFTMSATDLQIYLDECPRPLTLWVQNFPSQCSSRIDNSDKKCRYRSCPITTYTMVNGWHRVAFDEFATETSNGYKDPFKVAGSMHLYCFEQCIDPIKYRHLLQADSREFPKEEKNAMMLNRAPDAGVISAGYDTWFNEHLDKPLTKFPRRHKRSLAYSLTTYHLKAEPRTRANNRDARNDLKKVQADVKSIDRMKGNLKRYARILARCKNRKKNPDYKEEDDPISSSSESDDDDPIQTSPPNRNGTDGVRAPETAAHEAPTAPLQAVPSAPADRHPEDTIHANPAPPLRVTTSGAPPIPLAPTVSPFYHGLLEGGYNTEPFPSYPEEIDKSFGANMSPGNIGGSEATPWVIPEEPIDPNLPVSDPFDPLTADFDCYLNHGANTGFTPPPLDADEIQETKPAQSPGKNKRKRSVDGSIRRSPRSPKRQRTEDAQANPSTPPSQGIPAPQKTTPVQSPSKNKRKRSVDGGIRRSPRSPKRQRTESAQATITALPPNDISGESFSPWLEGSNVQEGLIPSSSVPKVDGSTADTPVQSPRNMKRKRSGGNEADTLFGSSPEQSPSTSERPRIQLPTPNSTRSSPRSSKRPRLSLDKPGSPRSSPRTPKQERTSLSELNSPENVRRNPVRGSRSPELSQRSRKSRTSI